MEGRDSEFANFTLPTSKTFLEARSQNVYEDAPKRLLASSFFSPRHRDLLVSKKQNKQKRKDTFFSTLHPFSPVIFATATVVAFVLLRNSTFNFHCYTQREAAPTQKSARK